MRADEFKSCARCRGPRYCSRECQKAAWRVHKVSCEPWEEADGDEKESDDLSDIEQVKSEVKETKAAKGKAAS